MEIQNQTVMLNSLSPKKKDLIIKISKTIKNRACDQIYNIPPALSKKATSFGYGNKYFPPID
jgi:hypothetical protein